MADGATGIQLTLFPAATGSTRDIEVEIQAILARRLAMRASGYRGEDIPLIRAALLQEAAAHA